MRGTTANYTKVLVLFGVAGTLVVAVALLLNLVPFRSSLWLAALPGFTFALLLVLTMTAASRKSFLPGPPPRPVYRGGVGGLILFLTLTVGLIIALITFFGVSADRPVYSDNPSPPVLSGSNYFAKESGILIAGFWSCYRAQGFVCGERASWKAANAFLAGFALVALIATATRPIFTQGFEYEQYEPFLLAGQITLSALKGPWVYNALETNGASPMAMPKA